MLINNKEDLINYLNSKIDDKFVIDTILAKMPECEERYRLYDTYDLEVSYRNKNHINLNVSKIEKIRTCSLCININEERQANE